MAGISEIEWTNCTWNPTRGCRRVSPGCENCYAERIAHRFSGPGLPYEGLVTLGNKGPRWKGEGLFVPDALDAPLHWKKSRKVFVDSMSDLFFDGFTDAQIDQVLTVMLLAYWHTFQVLTKRPERMASYLSNPSLYDRVLECAGQLRAEHPKLKLDRIGISDLTKFPAKWIWWGTSVEDQQRANERLPHLLRTPASVRFVSYEPALQAVNFEPVLPNGLCDDCGARQALPLMRRTHGGVTHCPACDSTAIKETDRGIDWLIIGGESGTAARPFDLEWARLAVTQGKAANVPVFVKQMGSLCKVGEFPTFQTWVNKARSWIGGTKAKCFDTKMRPMRIGGDMAMAEREGTFPVSYYLPQADRKGGDMAAWPEDLRVREFPAVQS